MKLNLVCTCGACPEQYDVFDENKKQVAYFRLRHGYFYASVPDVGGEKVYEAYTKGDGIFEDSERNFQLETAKNAVLSYYGINVEKEKQFVFLVCEYSGIYREIIHGVFSDEEKARTYIKNSGMSNLLYLESFEINKGKWEE